MEDQINLTDTQGKRIGEIGKLAAHQQGLLHEAFSSFVFNSKGELLLQKRAIGKYHSGGLWTNTCCGHPLVGEDLIAGAERRLQEEMGINVELKMVFPFIYKAALDHGLTEHEYDYVCIGRYDGEPILNPEEAEAYAWKTIPELIEDVAAHPEQYSYWLKDILKNSQFQDFIINKLN